VSLKLLITGFEPFGDQSINPSWEAVRSLPENIGIFKAEKLLLPVEFGRAAEVVLDAAGRCRPDVIICVGQAGGRKNVTPEMIAINLCNASSPDNAGVCPHDVPVVPDGPDAYFSTLPVGEMVKKAAESDLPCTRSYSAGTYVCNDLMYRLLHCFSGSKTRVGFIHVPFVPGQGEPCLPLEITVKTLAVLINSISQ